MAFLRSGAEFLVADKVEDHIQTASQVTGLSDGRFVVTWTDSYQPDEVPHYASVHAQIFAADGSKEGGAFLVSGGGLDDSQTDSAVTTLSDGRFVVTWTEDQFASDVYAQMFAADGSKVGSGFLVNATTAGAQGSSSVTGLSDGRFVVAWSDASKTGGDTSDSAVRAQIFAADGSKAGGEFLVNTTTVNHQLVDDVTTLANGRFVVTWTDYSSGGIDVRAQIFAANGSKVGGEFLVNTTTADYQFRSSVTALVGGGFVATWHDFSQTGGDTSVDAVRGQVFAANGSKVGAEFLVNTTTNGAQGPGVVTALADGRFVIAWTDSSRTGGDTSGYAVRAQVFAADGSKSGGEFLVNTKTADNQAISSLAALSDGRFVVTWTDYKNVFEGSSEDVTRAQIFDPTRYDGDGTAETVTGGTLVDTIYGFGGDDTLNGGGGGDFLYGGLGADTLNGGDGNDYLDGGEGRDTMAGGGGDDTYRVDNVSDLVVEAAGGGTDTVASLVGFALKAGVEVEVLRTNANAGTAAINLTGNDFAQMITGNAANNILNDGGGAGVDTLRGLTGDDIYQVGNSGAVIVEVAGQGNDTVMASVDYVLKAGVEVETLRTNLNAGTTAIDLTGNELRQHVVGNAGSNVLDGKGGNDKLQGLGGQDFFVFSTALGAGNVDAILDFVAADDTVRLENAIFTKLIATGALNPAFFRANTAGIPADGNDYILYDTTDGRLYYDADGTGAGARIHFATLTGTPAITAADFEVI